jgi:hypothetical protein
LTEITAWLDIPPSPDAARTEVAVDVLYGDRLIRQSIRPRTGSGR